MNELYKIESEAHYPNGYRPLAFYVIFPDKETALAAAGALAHGYYSGDGVETSVTVIPRMDCLDEEFPVAAVIANATWHGSNPQFARFYVVRAGFAYNPAMALTKTYWPPEDL